MRAYDFIFSKRLSHRISRHIIFWIVFLIYFYYINLIPLKYEDLFDSKTYRNAFELMIYFPVSVISVYVSIYILLPGYILPGRYFKLIIIVIGLTIIYFSMAWLLTVLLADLTRNVPYNQLPVSFRWFQPVRYGIGLPLTSSVLTTIIKLLKNWHLEQKENELLQRQKIDTEFQLLKSQFQPHFLYDALQNIFFLIMKQSPESPGTLLKLSDLLSYILYENENDHVPVEKELEMVKTYLGLKKSFYNEGLRIELNQHTGKENLHIAPLLLVSLVENCLENLLYTGKQQQLSLNLNIRIDKRELYFQLECKSNFESELSNNSPDHKWIESIRRIEVLYPGRHSFDVHAENGITHLLLILELDEISSVIKKEKEEFILS